MRKHQSILRLLFGPGCLFATAFMLLGFRSPAQAQTTCAQVKIEIHQQLTFEREAFEATLGITNEQDNEALGNLLVTVEILDENGADASSKFFVTIKSMQNTTGVDGTGTVLPQVKATIKWLIIPTADAGGTNGIKYQVLAGINYSTGGVDEYIGTLPAEITVKPQPKLRLDYFFPHYVEGDDPFTVPVEGSVPFSLGVRVHNQGYGTAYKLAIDSGQVEIVENKKNLLVAFRLLGAEINNSGVSPALKVNFGDLTPGASANARWLMIASLLGEFKDFNVTYTHDTELGGALTSLITSLDHHLLVHEVLVDTPGADPYTDFLAGISDFNINSAELPNKIYGSDGQDLPVTDLNATTTGKPTDANPEITVTTPGGSGWCYLRVNDPALNTYSLSEVVRSDGKVINSHNAWITKWVRRRVGEADITYYYLHILDNDPPAGTYQVIYAPENPDTDAPQTTIIYNGPNYATSPTYITSETLIHFYAYDPSSAVAATQYSVDGGNYRPALPFSIEDEGAHTINFYSTDVRDNDEAPHIASVMVDNSAPVINQVTAVPDPFKAGPLPDGNPKTMIFAIYATDMIPDLNASITISRGTAVDDEGFGSLPQAARLQGPVTNGAGSIPWNGIQTTGGYVPEGTHTARVELIDPLGNRAVSFVTFTVETLFDSEQVSPGNGNQTYPDLSGRWLVWQDERTGEPDVWFHNFATSGDGALQVLGSRQERPRVDGNIVIWQDDRNGNWDLFGWNLDTGGEFSLYTGAGDQKNAEISGPWVVFQDNRVGNWDIRAFNRLTGEDRQLTSHSSDQLNPVVEGELAAWDDYRWGLSEVYTHDLGTATEERITNDLSTQVQASLWGGDMVWVDRRTGNRDLFYRKADGNMTNVTNSVQDEAVPFLENGTFVFEDYSAGVSEPDLMLRSLLLPGPLSLARAPGAQRLPRMSGPRIVWQSNQDGIWQIYTTENRLPVALAGEDMIVDLGGMVALDGTGSYSPTGSALSYQWTTTLKPAGSTAALADANTVRASFTPDKVGTYEFSLTVSEDSTVSFPDEVRITVKLPGDIDGNGILERADIDLLLQVLNGVTVTRKLNLLAGVDGDGKLGLEELTYLTTRVGQ